MERSKRPSLALLAHVFAEAGVPYAIVGGVALQVHRREPRTTLDIDVVVTDRAAIPARSLEAAGFRRTASFEHSENWSGPDDTPVQITDDVLLAAAIPRAVTLELGQLRLRLLAPADLLHAKLRAAADPARRRSKRIQDLADAVGLLEDHPDLSAELSPAERGVLARAPD